MSVIILAGSCGWGKQRGKGRLIVAPATGLSVLANSSGCLKHPRRVAALQMGGCPCPWPGLQLVNNAHVFGHEFNLGANRVTRIQFVTVVANGNGNGKGKGLWLYSKGIWERDKLAWQIFASRPLFGVLRSQSQQQQQPPRDLLMQTMRIWYWKLTP